MTELVQHIPADEPISTSLDRADFKRRVFAVLLEHTVAFNGVCFCGDRTNPRHENGGLDHQTAVTAAAAGLPRHWIADVLTAHEIHDGGEADLTCSCGATVRGEAEYGVAEHRAEAIAATVPAASVRLYLNAARQRAAVRRREAAGDTMPHVLSCLSG